MSKVFKSLLFIFGSLCIALGVIGIFLPLLPTTPLILLGAFCYYKSSKTVYQKILEHKFLGKIINEYRSGNGIPLKSKIYAITVLWISIAISTLFFIQNSYLKIVLLLIASFVSVLIISFKRKLN